MTFDQWWATLETREQHRADKALTEEAFTAGAASRDAEIAELVAALKSVPDLINVVRMPNIEYVADNHNCAVEKLRAALAKVRKT